MKNMGQSGNQHLRGSAFSASSAFYLRTRIHTAFGHRFSRFISVHPRSSASYLRSRRHERQHADEE